MFCINAKDQIANRLTYIKIDFQQFYYQLRIDSNLIFYYLDKFNKIHYLFKLDKLFKHM